MWPDAAQIHADKPDIAFNHLIATEILGYIAADKSVI
jgi:hypothetical protein